MPVSVCKEGLLQAIRRVDGQKLVRVPELGHLQWHKKKFGPLFHGFQKCPYRVLSREVVRLRVIF